MFNHPVVIQQNEVGFLFRDQKFVRILNAGYYKFWNARKNIEVKKINLDSPELTFQAAQYLHHETELRDSIDEFIVKESERAVIYRDGLMKRILGTGQYYFYNANRSITVEILNIDEPAIASDLAMKLVGLSTSHNYIQFTNVEEGFCGLLYYNNQAIKELKSGKYFFWKTPKAVAIKKIDIRSKSMEVQGQELMTKDKVTLRINLSVRYRVANAVKVIEELSDHQDIFYRIVQLALRESVSTKTLEELLENKNAISKEIADTVSKQSEDMGLELEASGIRDIILPGEMKSILNQVIEAEKRSQANMIQRREETAATRSLLNTAKLLENNPVLLRLKELEASEKIAEKIGSITVAGGLDNVFSALNPANVLKD